MDLMDEDLHVDGLCGVCRSRPACRVCSRRIVANNTRRDLIAVAPVKLKFFVTVEALGLIHHGSSWSNIPRDGKRCHDIIYGIPEVRDLFGGSRVQSRR